MYVVRRQFRNYGQIMLPGSTIEPGSIKWFKSRLKDRFIIEVNEHNFNAWNDYFVNKFGRAIEVPEVPEALEVPEVPEVPEVSTKIVTKVKATVR